MAVHAWFSNKSPFDLLHATAATMIAELEQAFASARQTTSVVHSCFSMELLRDCRHHGRRAGPGMRICGKHEGLGCKIHEVHGSIRAGHQ